MLSGNYQNLLVYSLPHLYISGLNISLASPTVIALAPGQARDSNDNVDMPVGQGGYGEVPGPLFINTAVNGPNGLDTGIVGVSSNYNIYVIAASSQKRPVAGLISLSSNGYPLLPFGYDSWRLIGFVASNGSSVFTAASIFNASSSKAFYSQPAISVLAGGNAITFTPINLSSAIPTTTTANVIAILNVTFTPAAVGDTLQLRPTGSAATANLVTITGVAQGIPQVSQIQVMTGVSGAVPSIDYKVSASGDSANIQVAGYISTLS